MTAVIANPVDGMVAIQSMLMDRSAAMPDDVRAKLRELVSPGNSPVVGSVEACELIYARRDELPASLLEIGAQLAAINHAYNFHGMREENRASDIAATIMAMPGVASDIQTKEAVEAPAAKAEYLPAPEQTEVSEASTTENKEESNA